MATLSEIAAGTNALKAYVYKALENAGEGWEEAWITPGTFTTGCTAIINAADNGTQTPASRQANGLLALQRQLSAAGYGNRVTQAQCIAATAAVLSAIDNIRKSK